MVWFSASWTRAEKRIATLISPALIVLNAIAGTVLAFQSVEPSTGPTQEILNPTLPVILDLVWLGILLVVVAQVRIGIWLLVRAHRSRISD